MYKILAIVGAGDLGKQIAHYALMDNHYSKVVFFDDFAQDFILVENDLIGKIAEIKNSFTKGSFHEIIIAIGYKHLLFKQQIFNEIKENIPLGKIVHSSSWVDKTATIEDGCVIYPNCTIDANVKIGKNTILNLGCTVAHDSSIGNHCFLSPRVAIAGFSSIGERCIIGINSTIIDNLSICNNTQIGAGAVVVKNIEKSGVYVGNPAKFLR